MAARPAILRQRWRRLRSEASGGFMAAVLAIPHEVICGALAVAPLGAAFAPAGIQAAFYGCILSGFLAFLIRGTPAMINGSRPSIVFVLVSLATSLLQVPGLAGAPERVFPLLLVCTAMAGVIQLVIGLLRWGRALKFIPFPVLSGLMLGVAILTMLAALRPAFGIPGDSTPHQFLADWKPLSALVALVTVALCFWRPRWLRWLPYAFPALAGGTMAHYLLAATFGDAQLGALFPRIAGILPEYGLWSSPLALDSQTVAACLPIILSHALAIAAFGSLESLLSARLVQVVTHRPIDGDRELRSQGVLNLTTGLLGATATAGSLPRVQANLEAGGRSALSAVIFSLLTAMLILFGGAAIALLPLSVSAGLLLYLAYTVVDSNTRRLFADLFRWLRDNKALPGKMLAANCAIIIAVAMIAVLGDILSATGAGIIAAMVLFTLSSVRPVVRRISDGTVRRSCTVRSREANRILQCEGSRIILLELQGSMFFGTAEQLSERVQHEAVAAQIIIIDLQDVSHVDATGAQVLSQLAAMLHAQGRRLSLAGARSEVVMTLSATGTLSNPVMVQWFPDRDSALQSAEDHVLLESPAATAASAAITLDQTDLARNLSPREIGYLGNFIEKRTLDQGGVIFHAGDAGDSLFVAANRSVDIVLQLADGRRRRIVSFAPGVVFGEMALLEQLPRSAEACTSGPIAYWELSRAGLSALAASHPAIAFKILSNLGTALSARLRATTGELRLANEQT